MTRTVERLIGSPYTIAEIDTHLSAAAEVLAAAPPSQRNAALARVDRWLDRRLRAMRAADAHDPQEVPAHARA